MSQVRERKTQNLTKKNRVTQRSSNQINDPDRAFKGLHTPNFSDNREAGAVVIDGEADSALYMGQDARYGTPLGTITGSSGDFSNKIVLAVGFLNEGKKDGDEIDMSNPDLRYGAGLTIYQRTDTGKDAIFDKSNPKNTDRKATTLSPQKAVSVFEINADVIELKARNGGVNIIAGYDPTLPSYGDPSDRDRQNTEYVGVSLIGGGNPDEKILSDRNDIRGLQPMVKGDNLEDRLREMSKRISDVNNVLLQVIKTQKVTDVALALHTHAATFGLGPSIELGIALGAVKTPLDIFNVLSNITAKYNQVALSINMSSISEGGFKSFYNKTN